MVETFAGFPLPHPNFPLLQGLIAVDRPSSTRARMRATLPWRAGILVTFAWASANAHADVYKCAGENGRPVYQEMPCSTGKELRNFQTDPPEITVLPGSPRVEGPAQPA